MDLVRPRVVIVVVIIEEEVLVVVVLVEVVVIVVDLKLFQVCARLMKGTRVKRERRERREESESLYTPPPDRPPLRQILV